MSNPNAITKVLEDVARTLGKQLTAVLKDLAPRHGISDVDSLTQDLLVGLGLVELKVSVGKKKSVAEKSVDEESSTGEKKKKRVVSKKMKESFLKLEGATEEKLAEAMKQYKEAEDVESFDSISRKVLGLDAAAEAAPAPKAKAKKESKKKEKSGRFDKWTPTSSKLFKTIVEESGGVLSEELKKEFVEYVEALSDEDFASASVQGHMRAFVTTKFVQSNAVGGGPVITEEKEEKKEEEKDDDEDQEEFEFEGETLWIGVKSGKIFRPTEEAGDVLVGHAGKGRFKSVKKPE